MALALGACPLRGLCVGQASSPVPSFLLCPAPLAQPTLRSCTHTHAHKHAHACTHAYRCKQAHVHTCSRIQWTPACRRLCTRAHTSVHTHEHTHTHMCTHTHALSVWTGDLLQTPPGHTTLLDSHRGPLCFSRTGRPCPLDPRPIWHPRRSLPASSRIDPHTPDPSQAAVRSALSGPSPQTHCRPPCGPQLSLNSGSGPSPLSGFSKNPKELLLVWVICARVCHSRN